MAATSTVVSEGERLAALERYQIDAAPQRPFDDLVTLAAMVCGTPVALITVVEHSHQWVKASFGIEAATIPRELSFCSRAIQQDDVLIIPDTHDDPRFAANPFVVGEPGVRFYAGAPLVTDRGYRFGALCVMDVRPRGLEAIQLDALRMLARQAMSQLELRRHITESRRLERLEREQLAQMRRIFATTVSHELRTPLTSIRGSLGLLASGCAGSLTAEAKEMVAMAERNSVRLIGVINDILGGDADEGTEH